MNGPLDVEGGRADYGVDPTAASPRGRGPFVERALRASGGRARIG
jgi:hypothetical protein